MTRFLLLFRLIVFAIWTAAAGAVRRLVRGPLVEGWTWAMELRVVMMRAFIVGSMRFTDRKGRQELEALIDPPVPRRLRGLVTLSESTLGGVQVERVERVGDLEDVGHLLYLHGGAYVAGSPATHRGFTTELTWACRVATTVPAYRLAPDHPFPAALDDATAVYRALLDSGVDPRSVVVAGDSAGGGLAIGLLYRIRELELPSPACAVLFSPYTDLTHSGASIRRNVATDYLPDRETTSAAEYLAGADPRTPEASPLFGDLTGLPPLLVFAGSREMILDDSVRLAASGRAAGTDIRLHVEEGMFHVWPAVIPSHPASRRAVAMTTEFIEASVGAPLGRPG